MDSSAQPDLQGGDNSGSGSPSQPFDQLGEQASGAQGSATDGDAAANQASNTANDIGSGATSSTVSAAISGGTTTQTVGTAGRGIVFVNTFTANCTQAFENCIVAAEHAIQSQWSTRSPST
jgi:hypothetical protein